MICRSLKVTLAQNWDRYSLINGQAMVQIILHGLIRIPENDSDTVALAAKD